MLKMTMKYVTHQGRFERRYEGAKKRALYRIGSYVRTTMKRRFRKKKNRKDVSAPGEFPKAFEKQPFRTQTLFEVDHRRDAVYVGPRIFTGSGPKPPGKTVPEVVNEGGVTAVENPKTGVIKLVDIAPRPFVALTLALPAVDTFVMGQVEEHNLRI